MGGWAIHVDAGGIFAGQSRQEGSCGQLFTVCAETSSTNVQRSQASLGIGVLMHRTFPHKVTTAKPPPPSAPKYPAPRYSCAAQPFRSIVPFCQRGPAGPGSGSKERQ